MNLCLVAKDPGKMEEGTTPDGCLKLKLGEATNKIFFYFKTCTPDSNSARREQHFKHIKRVWYPCGCLDATIGRFLDRVTLQIARIGGSQIYLIQDSVTRQKLLLSHVLLIGNGILRYMLR